jgi:Catenin-beta-like, Arm-motif containing nuclear
VLQLSAQLLRRLNMAALHDSYRLGADLSHVPYVSYKRTMHTQFKNNMEMRMKYSEEPSKFMESEVDLDDAVKRMMVIPGSPELYPDFARTQVHTCCTLSSLRTSWCTCRYCVCSCCLASSRQVKGFANPCATTSEHVRHRVPVQAFSDLLGLLGHENADIAADVLELFKELTEEDVVQDSVE